MRFKRVRDYLIAYAPDQNPLWVLAVLHGRRSPRVMAAISGVARADFRVALATEQRYRAMTH